MLKFAVRLPSALPKSHLRKMSSLVNTTFPKVTIHPGFTGGPTPTPPASTETWCNQKALVVMLPGAFTPT